MMMKNFTIDVFLSVDTKDCIQFYHSLRRVCCSPTKNWRRKIVLGLFICLSILLLALSNVEIIYLYLLNRNQDIEKMKINKSDAVCTHHLKIQQSSISQPTAVSHHALKCNPLLKLFITSALCNPFKTRSRKATFGMLPDSR